MGISNVYSVEDDWVRISPGARQTAVQAGLVADRRREIQFRRCLYCRSGAIKAVAPPDAPVPAPCWTGMQAPSTCPRSSPCSPTMPAKEQSGSPFQTDLAAGPVICRHPHVDGTGGCTAAGLVADLCDDGSRLPVYWCCLYSPCLSLFQPIFIEGDLPPALSVGGATATDDSPWWLFYRLNLAVLEKQEERVPVVRERWARLQRQLLTVAYDVAGQGRRLIDDDLGAEAHRLLTKYMAANTESMLQTVVQLLVEFEQDVDSVRLFRCRASLVSRQV